MDQVKTKKKLLLKYVLWTLGTCLTVYVLLVAFLVMGPSLKSYIQQIPFDSNRWKESINHSDNIKQKMVPDLFRKHSLVGMSIEEVNELLGIPPATGYFKDYDYVYWLGPERGLGVDSEWLGIKFKDGKVTQADVLQD